ncbi:MAG: GTPase RsgA [Limisphaerales bacterium]
MKPSSWSPPADPTFNAARLERMLVMGHESGARPVIILNKIDLCDDLDAKLAEAVRAAGDTSGARCLCPHQARREKIGRAHRAR